MTTKLVFTMEEGNFPLMERYENDVKVGNRKITLEMLLRSFIKDASVDLIFDELINNRTDDIIDYFENVNAANDNGYLFLVILFNQIQDGLLDNSNFSELAKLVIDKAADDALTEEALTTVLSSWINKIKRVPCNARYAELYKDLLQYFLGSPNETDLSVQRELLKTIYKYLKGLKEKKAIDKWVAMHIEHLPTSILLDGIRARSEGSKMIYGFSKVPKNASFVATTSAGTTYFYEIPKSKIRVKFQDVAFENVGHPRLLFAITCVNDQVRGVKLCALKGKVELNLETELYHYPYSNVFTDGRVCWSGWDELPIDQIPLMFLSTSNNSHLNEDTLSLFQKYQNKNFNDRNLKPMQLTIENWC